MGRSTVQLCRACQKNFRPSDFARGGGIYCSESCRRTSPRARAKAANALAKREGRPSVAFKFPKKRKTWNTSYDGYINSGSWKAKRMLALAGSGNACQRCGLKADKGLHVHHLNYKRFGNERLSDLMVLCKDCHTKEHKLKLIVCHGSKYSVRRKEKEYEVFSREERVLTRVKSKKVAIEFAKGANRSKERQKKGAARENDSLPVQQAC